MRIDSLTTGVAVTSWRGRLKFWVVRGYALSRTLAYTFHTRAESYSPRSVIGSCGPSASGRVRASSRDGRYFSAAVRAMASRPSGASSDPLTRKLMSEKPAFSKSTATCSSLS
jgi:hypothetical protein